MRFDKGKLSEHSSSSRTRFLLLKTCMAKLSTVYASAVAG